MISCAPFYGETTNNEADDENKETEYIVSGTIQYSESYCGGARPTDEMLEEITRPENYPGKRLFVVNGNINQSEKKIIAAIISDSAGKFSVLLPPGEYCIIQPEQRDKKIFTKYDNPDDNIEADEKCLTEWFKTCLFSFKVESSPVTEIQLMFHRPCFLPEGIPCLSYTGPMPP